MVGKSKMKDWKAAVRTWERNSKQWNLFSSPAKKSNAVDLTKKMLEKYGGVKDDDDY